MTGRAQTPFMNAINRTTSAAIWISKNSVEKYAPNMVQGAQPLKVGHMPRFVEPQLCKLVERAPSGTGWAHEVKFDGYRLQLRVEDGEAILRTRKGLDWTRKFSAIAEAAAALPDCIIDGEACVLDRHGAPDFTALQAALSEGDSSDLIFFAFDLLFAEGLDLRGMPLSERKDALQTCSPRSAISRRPHRSLRDRWRSARVGCKMHRRALSLALMRRTSPGEYPSEGQVPPPRG